MKILLNGKNLDYTLDTEETVGEVLGSVESECEKAGMTVTSVRVDGHTIDAAALDALFRKSPDEVTSIELETLNGESIIKALQDLGKRFTDMIPVIEDIPVLLQTGKDLTVMETIHTFSVDIEQFYRLLPLFPLTGMDATTITAGSVPLGNYPGELAPLLSQLLDALKQRDTVLVGDIAEYELAPRLSELGLALQDLS
ncbi:MAG: hypothetical protein JW875_02335 [Spirochaetales bacterium]|nr:hypothetical protein [Spirochaetales bacterium]HNQ97128.1 hypothetical protein [Treponemataceae bacterium]